MALEVRPTTAIDWSAALVFFIVIPVLIAVRAFRAGKLDARQGNDGILDNWRAYVVFLAALSLVNCVVQITTKVISSHIILGFYLQENSWASLVSVGILMVFLPGILLFFLVWLAAFRWFSRSNGGSQKCID